MAANNFLLSVFSPSSNNPLMASVSEIGRLASTSGDPAETLANVVHLIQRRFGTDVCSVYLLEPDRASLVLAATIGLRPESVGRVRMRLTEGLAGLVAEELRAQIVADAAMHPRFKYFPEAGEDPYHSFLGVPIIDRGLLQGVLVVQTLEAEETTAGGIVLPDNAKEKPQRGKVLAVGPGKLLDSGNRGELSVTVGDEVIFGKYGGSEVEVEGEEYKILRETDILAKVVA